MLLSPVLATWFAIEADTWAAAAVTVVSVLLGVLAADARNRRAARAAKLEEATLELALLLPHVAAPMWKGWKGGRETRLGSLWSEQLGRANSLLALIRVLARRTRGDRGKRMRLAVELLSARLAAAQLLYLAGARYLEWEEYLQLTTASLWPTVFGDGDVNRLSSLTEHFKKEGIAAEPPTEP